MAAELLNTVSIASLAYTAVTLVVSYLVALLIGRKVSLIDRLVLWWIVWDGLIHLSLVCNETTYVEIFLSFFSNNAHYS